jgi:hypothetical protein
MLSLEGEVCGRAEPKLVLWISNRAAMVYRALFVGLSAVGILLVSEALRMAKRPLWPNRSALRFVVSRT